MLNVKTFFNGSIKLINSQLKIIGVILLNHIIIIFLKKFHVSDKFVQDNIFF